MRTLLIGLLVVGIALWFLAFWRFRKRLLLEVGLKKFVLAFAMVIPLVVLFALFQAIAVPNYDWRRTFTSDGRASAEFPCVPTTEDSTATVQGVTVRNLALSCGVPRRDINLRMTYNDIPPEGAGLNLEQRLGGLRSLLEQQGFTIISSRPDGHGDVPGYRFIVEKDQGDLRLLMRVVIAPTAIYRVVATSSTGFHDDPTLVRFLDSFSFQ